MIFCTLSWYSARLHDIMHAFMMFAHFHNLHAFIRGCFARFYKSVKWLGEQTVYDEPRVVPTDTTTGRVGVSFVYDPHKGPQLSLMDHRFLKTVPLAAVATLVSFQLVHQESRRLFTQVIRHAIEFAFFWIHLVTIRIKILFEIVWSALDLKRDLSHLLSMVWVPERIDVTYQVDGLKHFWCHKHFCKALL